MSVDLRWSQTPSLAGARPGGAAGQRQLSPRAAAPALRDGPTRRKQHERPVRRTRLSWWRANLRRGYGERSLASRSVIYTHSGLSQSGAELTGCQPGLAAKD